MEGDMIIVFILPDVKLNVAAGVDDDGGGGGGGRYGHGRRSKKRNSVWLRIGEPGNSQPQSDCLLNQTYSKLPTNAIIIPGYYGRGSMEIASGDTLSTTSQLAPRAKPLLRDVRSTLSWPLQDLV